MKPLILLIDQYDEVRLLVKEWLAETFPECRILEAKTGEEGIATACMRRPQIVVMDIGPVAFETTWRLKAVAPETKVVMFTLSDGEPYRSEASAVGVSAYVLKSNGHRELVPVIKGILSEVYEEHPEWDLRTVERVGA